MLEETLDMWWSIYALEVTVCLCLEGSDLGTCFLHLVEGVGAVGCKPVDRRVGRDAPIVFVRVHPRSECGRGADGHRR